MEWTRGAGKTNDVMWAWQIAFATEGALFHHLIQALTVDKDVAGTGAVG